MKEVSSICLDGNQFYLKDAKSRTYNSVEEMKRILDLADGDIIRTAGYYSANDGGGATYKIRNKVETDTEDNGSIHFINDTLVAELIVYNSTVNVKQFGCVGDGVTDDYIKFNNCVQYAITKKVKVHIIKGTYLISNMISVLQDSNMSHLEIFGDGVHKSLINFTSNIGLYIERGTPILSGFTIKGNNQNTGLQLGTATPVDIDDSIHWANVTNMNIINCKIAMALGNIFDSYFENIDIYYLYNTTGVFGIKDIEGNENLGFNNVVFNRIRIEDFNSGTAISLTNYKAVTGILFNNLHIEPRYYTSNFMHLKNCNEITINNFVGVSQATNQTIDDYISSFIFDNCRNIIFNNPETSYTPKGENDTTNKMIVLKNSNNNILFNDGYMEFPYSNTTSMLNIFDTSEMTGGNLPRFNGVGIGNSLNSIYPNQIALSRMSSTTDGQRFEIRYNDDNIIQIGRNLPNENYANRSKLNSVSGFNEVGDNIIGGIIPHNKHSFNGNGTYYHTIYGRNSFAGVYLLMVKYNNVVHLCIFSCNIPTTTTVKILQSTDNIFSNAGLTAGKFNIYGEGSNLVYDNRLDGACEMSVIPLYMDIL